MHLTFRGNLSPLLYSSHPQASSALTQSQPEKAYWFLAIWSRAKHIFELLVMLQCVKGQLSSEQCTNWPFHMHELTDTHKCLASLWSTEERVKPPHPHREHNQICSLSLIAKDGFAVVVIQSLNDWVKALFLSFNSVL